ncbi:LysR substrate-binding domain-containing protein [Hoeflea sp.]|uniref:LysR substrate-binding domain-containing protein n=1 Tax=Hoeflea sp. TaxID=1940281 RepID=UPI003B51E77A
MAHYRKQLPPLDLLVFFEAVMRKRSFTHAGEELLVSQAAVSKRIRQLEDWLGTELFERGSHRLEPSATARELDERVRMALDFMAGAVTKARAPGKSVVQLAAMNAIGMFWLQPRLRRFGLSDTACDFNVRLSDDPAVLLSGDNDLAVIYGDGAAPGWTTVHLFDEILAPVAIPEIADRLSREGLLGDHAAPLLDYERRTPDWIDWRGWAARVDRTLPGPASRIECSSYTHSVGRALAGRGVALGSLPLLDDELSARRLVRLDQPDCVTGRGYWLATPESGRHSPEAATLCSALMQS